MTNVTNSKPSINIEKGWNAFVKDSKCIGYHEFKEKGKYWGNLEIVNKPTETELKAELASRNISTTK